MGSKKYSLQPLVDVRREKADAAKRELSASIRAREEKQEQLAAARQRTLAHKEAVEGATEEERTALLQGHLRAVDLFRQNAWEMEQQRQQEALERAETRSAEELTQAHTAEQGARATTASRLGELKAVERDRERFLAEQKRRQLNQEEEAAEEAWRPRSD